jgi:hypothetical protein
MCNALQYEILFGFLCLLVGFTFPILFVFSPQDAVEPPHQQNNPTNTATKMTNGPRKFPYIYIYDYMLIIKNESKFPYCK